MALIAHWPLNGNTNDVSGNGYDGTPTNITFTAGKIGQAASFSSGRIDVKSNGFGSFNFQEFSIAAWVRYDGSTGDRIIWAYDFTSHVQPYYSQHLRFSHNNIVFAWNDGTQFRAIIHSIVIPANTWTHISGTFKFGEQKLYVNGALVQSSTRQDVITYYNSPVQIGAANYTTGTTFIGNDIRVFNHALTDMEIQEIARAKILHYSFDDFQEPTTNLYRKTDLLAGGTAPQSIGYFTGTTSVANISDPFGTTRAIRLTGGSNPVLRYGSSSGGNPEITTGKTYTFSIYARLVPGQTVPTQLVLDIGDTGNTNLISQLDFTWKRVQSTITPNINAGYGFADISISNGGVIELAFPQIEEKLHSTEFVVGSRTAKVNDYSGFFNHSIALTEANTPRWVSDSKIGTGTYQFSSGRRILTSTINLGNGNNEWTAAAWVKTTTTVNSLGTGSVFSNQSGGPVYSLMGVNSGKIVYWTYQNNNWSQKLGNSIVNDGNWHFLTWVNYNNYTMNMYVDGMLDANVANSTSGNNNPIDIIGASWTASFDGLVDDPKIYMTALSDKDILDLYNTKAEIEQSGVLYARDFLSNAEETVNLIGIHSELPTLTGWDSYGFGSRGTREIVFVNPALSGNTIKVTNNSATNGLTEVTRIISITPLINGNKLTVTGYVKGEGSSIGKSVFTHIYANSSEGALSTGGSPIVLTNNWQRITHTFTWTRTVNSFSSCNIYFVANINIGEYFYVSNPQLEFKSYATPFVSTFRPAIELPTGVQFGADEIHETGIANFEDFSTVGITDGLIGYWPLDKNAKDYSGSNYNLTDPNANVLIQDGARFTGTSAQKLFVENFPKYTSNFTWSVDLINTVQNTNQQFVVSLGRDCCNVYGMNIRVLNGIIDVFIGTNTIINTGISCVNQLRNVTVSVDSTNVRVYVDGVQTNIIAIPVFAYGPQTALVVGKMSHSYTSDTVYFPFNGTIKNFKIFNRALKDEEIKIEYNTQFNNEVQIHEDGTLYAKNIIQY
jgi:hypothetical protein